MKLITRIGQFSLALVLGLFVACALPSEGGDVATPDYVALTPLMVEAKRVFPHLKVVRPVVITHAGDGSDRIFVVSQLGTIHVFPNRQDARKTDVFLDIQSRVAFKQAEHEVGLLGLAFHPNYRSNGMFFVHYPVIGEPYILRRCSG